MHIKVQNKHLATSFIKSEICGAADLDPSGELRVRRVGPKTLEFYGTCSCSKCGATLIMPNWPVVVEVDFGALPIPEGLGLVETEYAAEHQQELYPEDVCGACSED